jgi:SAM-dependent methyltransferase
MPRTSTTACVVFAWIALSAPVVAQVEPPKTAEPKAKAKAQRRTQRPGPAMYMGREIAPAMSYLGADWLERPERIDEENPEAMIDALKIKPGDVVADFGAGSGFITRRLARRVGNSGTVFAVDIQPQMVQILRENLREAGIKNVRPVLSTVSDPKLPEGKVDLVLMVDVYHECSEPEAVLKGIKKALKPGGRLVLVEYRGEDPEVPIKPEHKMTVDQVRKELEPQGFALKDRHEFLPWQHVLVFEKPREESVPPPKPAVAPEPKDEPPGR